MVSTVANNEFCVLLAEAERAALPPGVRVAGTLA
ncbi:hypothetical protein QO019_005818 [Streptomyces thermodiastaticus]|uniref:Uncharacterized protein n=1 Tax=Streptomyces thermodiastaticus TaxID=44061 RepID=A0ABU0KNT1_9ACTN|nr:hypothetical protein [Streptomyces thermodiastaticus]